jgi:hypothetical protein
MRLARLLPFAIAFLLAGCGGSAGPARNDLRAAAQKLGQIRAGVLDLKLLVTPLQGTNGRIGFELSGPFKLRKDALPIAKLRYTQYAGANVASATFVSTGTQAYALSGGRRVALPASAAAEIEHAAGGITGGGAETPLRIDNWLDYPSVSDGGTVGGASTDHVTAKLDVVNAANGLLGFVRTLGHATPTITGSSADQLRKAVKSSSIDVWIGKRDKLLRKLDLKAQLGFDVPKELQRALGNVVGANVEFLLAVSNPNRPIQLTP